jgi:hypothetical protein
VPACRRIHHPRRRPSRGRMMKPGGDAEAVKRLLKELLGLEPNIEAT